jgi:hypothetical protein
MKHYESGPGFYFELGKFKKIFKQCLDIRGANVVNISQL